MAAKWLKLIVVALAPGWIQPSLAQQPHFELVADVSDATRTVEMLWQAPSGGTGPWPAILFVHGYQDPDPKTGVRPGARKVLEDSAAYPLFDIFRKKGFLVAFVSQAGYGRTDGPLDFCGPASQRAIVTAVAALRRNGAVRRDEIFVHGRSRGAISASMAVTAPIGAAGVILESGIYDMRSYYEQNRGLDGQPYRNITENIEREAGTSNEAFVVRSLLLTDRSIPVPVLLLHGTADIRAPIDNAIRLEAHLRRLGGTVRLVTYPGEDHQVPVQSTAPEIDRFIRSVLETAH